MKSIEWYKARYPDPENNEISMLDDHTILIPLWLKVYFLRRAGVKSKKKRLVKKILKRMVHHAIWAGLAIDEASRSK